MKAKFRTVPGSIVAPKGFLASGVAGMAGAVARADEISPERCREDVVARFDPHAMVNGYERIYREILEEL